MEQEIKCLLSGYADEIKRIIAVRVQSERKDAYCRIIREVLLKSSLCYINKELHYFDGRAYSPISRADVVSVVINTLADDMGVGASDLCRLGDIPYTVLDKKVKLADIDKVAFLNCVYDIRSVRCLRFSPEHCTAYSLSYRFDSRGECPMWQQFLDEVLPDRSVQMCLQEFFGMCFVDRQKYSIEKFALFVGKGANGKSVICEVIKNVLGGDVRVDNLSPDQLQDPKQVVSLNGKILNIAPDVRRGAAFDSCLKALSSSQVVKGWAMYRGSQEVKCPPLAFALNELPVFRDTTFGFFRRILLFSFNYTVPEEKQDKQLASRLIARESSGIFKWIMEGRRRLIEHGGKFTDCPSMVQDTSAMEGRIKTEQSPVLQYLETAGWSVTPSFVGQTPEKVSAQQIYEGMEAAVSKYNITHELRRYGVHTERGKEIKYSLYKIQ